MPAVSLTDLQQQIDQRERELQALREELQSRQSHFTELTRRKEELQNQLQQVEEEIATLEATATAPTEQPTSATPVVAPSPAPVAPGGGQPRLGELIVTLLRESRVPMTARQLIEEAQRHGYQPASRDPVKAVENRLQDLKNRGIVQRASGQRGFILASSANGAKKGKSQTHQATPTSTRKAPAKPAQSEPTAQTAPSGRRGGQPPLREVLTSILKSSRKPLSGSELAQRALAAGYKTVSAKFVDSVWSLLGQMDNVEHVPQKGYRLKKT